MPESIYISDDNCSEDDSGSEKEECRECHDRTTASNKWMDVDNVHLKQEDKEILMSKDMWLNDNIINAAQKLLKCQFNYIGGFQDTILQSKLQFSVESGEFIQILNKNNNHWILVTNVGTQQFSCVRIVDSLGSKHLPLEIQNIIASMLHSPSPEINLKFDDVHQQNDSNSCGLFAVAFATSLCFGQSVSTLIYDKSKMRSHLMQCLLAKKMSPFPITGTRKPRLGKLSSFRVHCSCRMPLNSDDVFNVRQCSLCSESYHKHCIDLKRVVLKNIPGEQKWICKSCSDECKLTDNWDIININNLHSSVTISK